MNREITGGWAWVVALVFITVALLLSVLFSVIIIGFIGVLYFDAAFKDGWHMAWERWGWTLFFGLFVFGSMRSKS